MPEVETHAMRPRPIEVRALPGFRIWVRFADGSEGTVDLTHLVGVGVFAAFKQPGFDRAFVSPDAQTVTWPGELDLDPDVLYAKATGVAIPRSDAA